MNETNEKELYRLRDEHLRRFRQYLDQLIAKKSQEVLKYQINHETHKR